MRRPARRKAPLRCARLLFALRRRLFGERLEILENLLGERFIAQQRTVRIRDDELVRRLAVADGVAVVLVVLDQADDFELDRLALVGLEDDEVFELEGRLAVFSVPGTVRGFDGTYSFCW